jgi:hypothetical protein
MGVDIPRFSSRAVVSKHWSGESVSLRFLRGIALMTPGVWIHLTGNHAPDRSHDHSDIVINHRH